MEFLSSEKLQIFLIFIHILQIHILCLSYCHIGEVIADVSYFITKNKIHYLKITFKIMAF